MSYKVITPLVIVPNDDGTSGDLYAYQDGLIAEGWNDARCEQLVAEKMLVKVAGNDFADFDPEVGGGIDETKVYVGEDAVRARALLDLEAQRERPRSTLVKHLESVIG